MICRFQRAGEHGGGTTWQCHKQKDKGQYVGCGEHGLDNEQIQVKREREREKERRITKLVKAKRLLQKLSRTKPVYFQV